MLSKRSCGPELCVSINEPFTSDCSKNRVIETILNYTVNSLFYSSNVLCPQAFTLAGPLHQCLPNASGFLTPD